MSYFTLSCVSNLYNGKGGVKFLLQYSTLSTLKKSFTLRASSNSLAFLQSSLDFFFGSSSEDALLLRISDTGILFVIAMVLDYSADKSLEIKCYNISILK